MIDGNKPARDEFHGIHLPGGVSFNKNSFIIVYKNKWSQWKPLGKDLTDRKNMRSNDHEINNAPIGTVEVEKVTDAPEAEDEEDGDSADGGALILIDEKSGKYAKIRGKQICNYKITESKCTLLKKCSPVKKDKNRFPPNIVAVLRDRRKSWFFFNEKGKYCQRKDDDTKQVGAIEDLLKVYSNSVLFDSVLNGRITPSFSAVSQRSPLHLWNPFVPIPRSIRRLTFRHLFMSSEEESIGNSITDQNLDNH